LEFIRVHSWFVLKKQSQFWADKNDLCIYLKSIYDENHALKVAKKQSQSNPILAST